MEKHSAVIVFIILLALIAYPSKETCGQDQKEPDLIWQKDFGSDIRRFKLHRDVGPEDFPVMAVETEDALIVFDREGNEITKRRKPVSEFVVEGKTLRYRGYLIISDNGKYILEGKHILEISTELKYTTINGKVLWEKKGFSGEPEVFHDGDTVVLLNFDGGEDKEEQVIYDNSGKLVGTIPPMKGSVEFYDRSGKLLKQHFIDLSSMLMPLYRLAFSEDGNYFVLRVEQVIEGETGREAIYPIFFFDKKGNLLWERNIETTQGKTPPFSLLISPYGGKIAYAGDHNYIVDKAGNLLWKKESHSLSYFSDENNLVMRKRGDSYSIVNSFNGNELWSVDQGYPIISPEGSAIVLIRGLDEEDGKKLLFYAMDKEKKEKTLVMKKYPLSMNRKYQFSSDSRYLYYIVEEGDRVSVYKLSVPMN
jgi:hypothetical protein